MQVTFGEFVLDLDSRELRRAGEPIRLSPKAFQLLEILVTARPRALSKSDLQDRLWPDTFVVEKNLANLVSEIRQALGESPQGSRFIRTVQRYGYAFNETARQDPDRETASSEAGVAGHRRSRATATALALAVLAAGVLVAVSAGRCDPPARIMLAVLPFENLTGDPEQDFLCDGLTEELIAQLGGLQPARLGVIARTSALQYKRTTKGAAEIGRELGVQFLLETSVRRVDDRFRITAQLIEIDRQSHVWAEQRDFDTRDILALQREVATVVGQRVVDSFSLGQSHAGSGRPSSNPAAYEHYLRGRWHWAKDTAEGLQRGKEHFEKAIALDAGYAQAHSGLADAYALLGSYGIMPIGESHPLGRQAAQTALQLDDTLADAHRSLAAILGDYYWEWTEAERHFRRSLELAPNDVRALHFYSFYLAYTGRSREAIPLAQRAIGLDPLSLAAQVNLGVILNMARRYDDAVGQFERALELDSAHVMAHAMLGLSYAYKNLPDRAVSEMALARKADGRRPDLVALHGYALARAGHTAEAFAAIDELRRRTEPREPSPFFLAVVAVGLDDKDGAYGWLEKAVEERYWALPMLKADPIFDSLRSDPRFPVILDRLGLPH
jgi:TolB-like protein/DNA-binding winged helix-turn-helix (wHTH) protein/Tfp pilus assembly protein PilF